jgi:PemK-like, MazF-like toxin of type II toxin-antitoxin system
MGRLLDFPRRVLATIRHSERNTGRTTRRRTPSTRPTTSGVRIEYTPHLDGDPDPGEVVWTWVPFEEDPTLGKDRPVVIIGRHGDLLSGVALTSKHKPGTIEVGSGPWDGRGRRSFAKVDRLLDIDPANVRREGAALSRRRFDTVIEAVDRLHHVVRT